MKRAELWAALAAVIFAFCAGGCDLAGMDRLGTVTEDFMHSYPLAPGGSIEVFSRNGKVEVLGWEKDTVEIRGTKYARNQTELGAVKVEIAATPGALVIRSIFPDNRSGGKGVRYIIRAPFSAVVNTVETSNGSIRVEQIARASQLRTSNGSMTVSKSEGPLAASTSNGSIRVTETKGDLRLKTSNGRIEAEDVAGGIRGETSNGSIRVSVAEPASGEPLQLETSNGAIELTMRRYAGNPMVLESSNGGITLRLPRDTNATVAAKTSNSTIQSGFPVSASGAATKNTLDTTLGSGGPLIKLTTSNGGIRLLGD